METFFNITSILANLIVALCFLTYAICLTILAFQRIGPLSNIIYYIGDTKYRWISRLITYIEVAQREGQTLEAGIRRWQYSLSTSFFISNNNKSSLLEMSNYIDLMNAHLNKKGNGKKSYRKKFGYDEFMNLKNDWAENYMISNPKYDGMIVRPLPQAFQDPRIKRFLDKMVEQEYCTPKQYEWKNKDYYLQAQFAEALKNKMNDLDYKDIKLNDIIQLWPCSNYSKYKNDDKRERLENNIKKVQTIFPDYNRK